MIYTKVAVVIKVDEVTQKLKKQPVLYVAKTG